MPGKIKTLQAMTTQYYHVVPDELSLVTVTPERSAIFQYLSRIHPDRFVEFITDILVHVEKHTLVDKTEGPGDEKQDVLTIDPSGSRHLAQCKHTVNYGDNATGDELDLLVAACLRKNCRGALYVTNADLTPQAKRYVTDSEYARGWKDPSVSCPTIDYWNGSRIWERIARSNTILNKWFSGMAQSHGLRSFFFDLVLRRMPDGAPAGLDAGSFCAEFARDHAVTRDEESASFDVRLDADLAVNISDWLRGSADLGLPFLDFSEGAIHCNLPLPAIRVHAYLPESIAIYDPAAYRDRITELFSGALPATEEGRWWHVMATPPQAFVFAPDIGKAILVTVAEPMAYVRVGNTPSIVEQSWTMNPGPAFAPSRNLDDEDAWRHDTTGAVLRVVVEQIIHPAALYEQSFRQKQVAAKAQNYTFRAIEHASSQTVEMVRRLSHPEWFVFQSNTGSLLWAYPPNFEQRSVQLAEDALERHGVKVLGVREKDKKKLLRIIDQSPPDATEMLISDARNLTTPIDLRRRTFWLSKEAELQHGVSPGVMLNILKFKASYEAQYGFDLLHGRRQGTFAVEELRRLLFDPLSLRGQRMLDVGFRGDRLFMNLRFRESSPASAAQLSSGQVLEFQRVEAEIFRLLSAHSANEPKSGGDTGSAEPSDLYSPGTNSSN